jgi:hypothetical protein
MDKYSIYARLYPVVLLLLPIVVIGFSYSFQFNNVIHGLSSIGISASLLYLFSNLGRDRGKLCEPKLWIKWGGPPTRQLLSFKNDKIDPLTKKRYHTKLEEFCASGLKINEAYEIENQNQVSQVYDSWVRFLISKSRDTKKYSILLKENISYGFRRNLWGLKPISITFLSFCLLGNWLYYYSHLGIDLLKYPLSFIISEAILIVLLFFWIFLVTTSWIKIPAFGYAERLLESAENLS